MPLLEPQTLGVAHTAPKGLIRMNSSEISYLTHQHHILKVWLDFEDMSFRRLAYLIKIDS